MKKVLLLSILSALFFCRCVKPAIIGTNDRLCVVKSVEKTDNGYCVNLDNDTVFCKKNPKLSKDLVVIFNTQDLSLTKLFYYDKKSEKFYPLENNHKIYEAQSIERNGDKYVIYTKDGKIVMHQKPEFKKNGIFIMPDSLPYNIYDQKNYRRLNFMVTANGIMENYPD